MDEGGKGKKVKGFFNTGIPKLLFKKYDLWSVGLLSRKKHPDNFWEKMYTVYSLGQSSATTKYSHEWLECLTIKLKSQWSWVLSQHPPTQWNLRGGRWSSVKQSTFKIQKNPPVLSIASVRKTSVFSRGHNCWHRYSREL